MEEEILFWIIIGSVLSIYLIVFIFKLRDRAIWKYFGCAKHVRIHQKTGVVQLNVDAFWTCNSLLSWNTWRITTESAALQYLTEQSERIKFQKMRRNLNEAFA